MVTATGCRISLPGWSPPIMSGSSAIAADTAVISTGVMRSRQARRIVARSKGWPSRSTRLSVWLTLRMPLRAVMPASVMKPTIAAIERSRPARPSAATEPTRASGTLPMMMRASAPDRYRDHSTRKMSARDTTDSSAMVREACCWARNCPSISSE